MTEEELRVHLLQQAVGRSAHTHAHTQRAGPSAFSLAFAFWLCASFVQICSLCYRWLFLAARRPHIVFWRVCVQSRVRILIAPLRVV